MKRIVSLVAFLTLVGFASAVAQPKPAPEPARPTATSAPTAAPEKVKIMKFRGLIDKIDEAAKITTVKTKVKKEEKVLTFVTDEKTKIIRDRKEMAFGDLKQGMSISVDYRKEGDKLIALKIAVAASKPSAKPKEEPKK